MPNSWPYRFVNFDPEQVQYRRILLDKYGSYAQISVLFPLTYTLLLRLLRTETSQGRQAGKSGTTDWTTWSNTPIRRGWETRGQILIATLWVMWLVFLSTNQTGDDYMHVTKRIGHIAVSQLPLHYLLALKDPLNPLQLITGLSYTKLNPYHRLHGRIIQAFLTLHAVLYLNFFASKGVLLQRTRAPVVQLGLAAVSCISILTLTSLATVRRHYRQYFYVPHITFSLLLLPAVYYHVSYTRPYIIESGILYVVNFASRTIRRSNTPQKS